MSLASRVRAGSTVINTTAETRQESKCFETADFLKNEVYLHLTTCCFATKGKGIKESQCRSTISVHCIPQYRLVATTAGLEWNYKVPDEDAGVHGHRYCPNVCPHAWCSGVTLTQPTAVLPADQRNESAVVGCDVATYSIYPGDWFRYGHGHSRIRPISRLISSTSNSASSTHHNSGAGHCFFVVSIQASFERQVKTSGLDFWSR